MTKLEEHDVSKESLAIREMFENLKQILNFGNLEVDVTAAGAPAFDAPNEPKFVLSVFGAQVRLYVSYLGEWYYATLTQL